MDAIRDYIKENVSSGQIKVILFLMVVLIVVMVIYVSGMSFIGISNYKRDENVSIYKYFGDKESIFQNYGIEDDYVIFKTYDSYLKFVDYFYDQGYSFEDEFSLYKDSFFSRYNLIVSDIYKVGVCGASSMVNDDVCFHDRNITSISVYNFSGDCAGGVGFLSFYEVAKSVTSASLSYVDESDNDDDLIAAKPVLYLYPKRDMDVSISFSREDFLTTTYPKYRGGWKVHVTKDGDIVDDDGKWYYALYWEESNYKRVLFDEGFYVRGDEAISFLEEKLSMIGFNNRERNEFIMYWLPIMEENGDNLVYFEMTDSKEEHNRLIINPKPDSLLRVTMHVKKVEGYTKIKEQKLECFSREGFSVVEWGGVLY